MAVIHPSIEVLKAFGHGNLDDAQAGVVSRHIDTCSDCLNTVASLSGDTFLGRVQDAHARPAMPPVIPPELLNHPEYEDIVELSRGGMGVVYVARQRLMNRHVALKIINQSLLDEPGATERFVREIQAAATLDHPNIVKAYTAFQAGRLLVFVMEYVAGEDLAQLVRRIGPLPVPNACGYVQQAARGLQHAFEKGLVHRDIKPQNIMLTARGVKPHIKHVIKILDFGLAKARKPGATRLNVTGTGSLLGTPLYIAPEQIEDAARADIRADLYSLGCTLYFLLTGAPPFDGASEIKLLDSHRRDKPRSVKAVRPEVPGELTAIVDRLLLKKPADRYQTPREVAEVLAPFFKAGIKPIRLLEDAPTPTPKQAEPRSGEPLRPTVADGIPVATLAPPIPPTVFEIPGGLARTEQARGADRRQMEPTRSGTARAKDPNAGPLEEPRGLALPPLWVRLVFASYLAMLLLVFAGPLVVFALSEKAGPGLALVFLSTVFLMLGASLLVIPIGHQWNVPRAKRSILIPCVGSATCAALLFLGGSMAFHEFAFEGPGANEEVSAIAGTFFGFSTLLIWIFWGVVFGIMARSVDRLTLSDRMYKALLLGSVSELLIAIPMHLIVRRRAECCAGVATAFGIGMGVTVMFIALGPAVFFLFFRRYRQTYAGRTKAGDGPKPLPPLSSPPKGHRKANQKRPWKWAAVSLAFVLLAGLISLWCRSVIQEKIPEPLRRSIVTGDYDLTGGYRFVHFGKEKTQVLLVFNGLNRGSEFARVYDLNSGQALSPPLWHRDSVYASFSPDGQRVVTASCSTKMAQIWDAATGKEVTSFKHEDSVYQASFSPDGQRVVTASGDKTARLWDAATGKEVTSPLTHESGVWRAWFSADGQRVVTVAGTTGQLWDATTGKEVTPPLKHGSKVEHASFSPDGKRVVTTSEDKTARLWDSTTGKEVTPPLKHESSVLHASFSPDGQRVVTAAHDAGWLWDAATGKEVTPPLKHKSTVWHVSFSPDGQRVITASHDTTARLWNAITGKQVTPPLKHEKSVDRACFSPDGRWVATYSRDGMEQGYTARLWDATTGTEWMLATLPPELKGLAKEK